MGGFGFFSEDLSEDAGFVAAPTGDVEETAVVFFGEVGVEEGV